MVANLKLFTDQVTRFIHSKTLSERMKTSYNNKILTATIFATVTQIISKFLSSQNPLTMQSFQCILLTSDSSSSHSSNNFASPENLIYECDERTRIVSERRHTILAP